MVPPIKKISIKSMKLIYNSILRMINRVCDKSLMYAFQQQKRLVDDHMVNYISENEMLTVAGRK